MENNTALATQKTAVAQFNFFDAEQFETMQRICRMFANSELVPDMYKTSDKNPEAKAMANCMIAIEIAQRIGASPLMIMQNMIIIYGRPGWSSKFLIATVNTCGRFNPLQYRFEDKGKLGKISYTEYTKTWVAGTNGGKGYYKNEPKTSVFDGTSIDNLFCVAFTTEKGSKDLLESSPVSIELAVQEGWYTKAGSKWKTMTKQMLMYRAASFWTSAYAPELSMGMKTEDEIRDIEDVSYEDVTESAKKEQAAKANKKEISITDNEGGKEEPEPKPEESDQPTQQPAEEKKETAAAEVKEDPKPKANPGF